MDASTQYTIRIRLADGTSITRTVAAKVSDGYYQTIDLTSSVTATEGAGGNLFMFGSLSSESVDLLVQSIEPMDNYCAKLTLVDYSPAVYDVDDEPIPAFNSKITLPPKIEQSVITVKPTITALKSDESVLVVLAPGKYQYRIRVTFSNAKNAPKSCKYIEGQIILASSTGDDWESTKTVEVGKVSDIFFDDVQESAIYKMRLRYVSMEGRVGPWATSSNHTVVGKTSKPQAVTGLTAVESGNEVRLDWANNTEPDLDGYEVRTSNANWGLASPAPLFKGKASEYKFVNKIPGTYTYYVKAFDTLRNYSVLATSVNITLNSPSNVSAVTQTIVKTTKTVVELALDWNDVAPTTFDVAGYEIRTSNTNWGTTTGYLYKGRASAARLTNVSATAATTFYIRTYDVYNNYSTSSFSFIHDVTAPVTMATASVTVTRLKAVLQLQIVSAPTLPNDFDEYEFQIGKVGSPGIPDGTTDNFWNNANVQIVESTTKNAQIDLNKFPTPRFTLAGTKYRVAVRMRDKSGNYSPASALGSILVTKIT